MKMINSKANAQTAKRAAGAGGYRIVAFPKEFERGLFGAIDVRYYGILLASLVVIFTTISILANLEYSEEDLQSALTQRYIQEFYAGFEEPVVEETTDEALVVEEEGAGQQEEEVDERAQRDEGRRTEATGTSAAESRERARREAARRASQRSRMQQQVAGTGILGELSAGGGGGSGDAVYDVLGESGSGAMGDLDNVLSNVGGLQSASSANRRSSLGERQGSGGRSSGAGIDDLISTGAGAGTSVSINRSADFAIKGVEGSVAGKGTKSSSRSQDAIARVVVEHADAIENCYKKESRLNPNLKGSVTAQFVIDPSGRVTNVDIVDSSLRNRQVENCISRRIRSWRFDRIDQSDGDVTARYKWIFSP